MTNENVAKMNSVGNIGPRNVHGALQDPELKQSVLECTRKALPAWLQGHCTSRDLLLQKITSRNKMYASHPKKSLTQNVFLSISF